MQEESMVRWRCRRGMLEIDMFLLPFYDQHYHELTNEQKAQFTELLTYTDPELFAWLMGHEIPPEEELVAIVEIIRAKHQPNSQL